MNETQGTPDTAFGSHAGKVRKGDGRRQRGNRTGFTTGACSAAAARAATLGLVSGAVPESVRCRLPNGQEVNFTVIDGRVEGEGVERTAHAVIVKDAGDDPDATNGAHLTADIRLLPGRAGELVLKGGPGVGTVTKEGLGLDVGGPAINPVPRRNIRDNVTAVAAELLAHDGLEVALSVPDLYAKAWENPEAHNSLGELLYHFDRDWAGAEREFKRALQLNPGYAPAHHWYSMYLSFMGRKPESLAEAEKAEELDPLSPVVGANLAKILQENGEYDKAFERAKKTLELDPNSAVTHAVLGMWYEDKKIYPDAIREYKLALQLGGESAEMHGLLGYAYAAAGDRGNAEQAIHDLKQLWPERSRAALDIATIYSGLGQNNDAIYWLGKANEKDVGDLISIGKSPRFAALHGDQRFQALVKQLGTP